MKVLLVSYCFGPRLGQAMIGVYKRSLRVALQLCERGHEVSLFCSGRENYEDEVTRRAARRMRFVDWPFLKPAGWGAELNRRNFLQGMSRLAPDAVVIGEAPLAGVLLEASLCALELEIPIVCLDNAYRPNLVDQFCMDHGPFFDALILTGPSSFHTPSPPPYLVQVPPFIIASPAEASKLIRHELGLNGEKLIVVLAYDRNVEELGSSLLARLPSRRVEAIFLSNDPEGCRQRLAELPPGRLERVRVIPPCADELLFGLIEQARLVVGKCAFMQVSECLCLRTPIIGFYFEGQFHLSLLPDSCSRFLCSTSSRQADGRVLAEAQRFLEMGKEQMLTAHDGRLGAAERAAQVIEGLPSAPRTTLGDCDGRGLSIERMVCALQNVHDGSNGIRVRNMRLSNIRNYGSQHVFQVACHYDCLGGRQFKRLWWRTFDTKGAAAAEAALARKPGSGRELHLYLEDDAILIERDVGEANLLTLEEAETWQPG